MKTAQVVVVAIHTPALFERPAHDSNGVGRHHEAYNRPRQIADLFKRNYQNLKEPRLVILAPVKCETYMKDPTRLVQMVRSGYHDLLDVLGSGALRSNVSVVLTPVQTVGSVVFSRIEEGDGEPVFVFRKRRRDAGYAPCDAEQPLRYSLRFLLNLHMQAREWPLFNWVRDWLGTDKGLQEAAAIFARGCKSDGGFGILQEGSGLRGG
jgi:hypothetical protein